MSPSIGRRLFVVALLAGVLGAFPASSQEADGNHLVVVLNARNPTRHMTTEQLKNMMLGNVSFWHGVVPIKLFVRPAQSPAAQTLFDKVLQLPATRFNEMWTARQLAGQGISPTVLGSPEQVVAEVAKVPGAVGVMLQSEAWGVTLTGVTVIPLN